MRYYGWFFDSLDELSRYTREAGLASVGEKVREVRDALSNAVDAQTARDRDAVRVLSLEELRPQATHFLEDHLHHRRIRQQEATVGTVIDFAVFLTDRSIGSKRNRRALDEGRLKRTKATGEQ